MAPMTLPQAEIDRIAADAFKYATDRPPELESHIRQESFIAGAYSEAIRGREQMVGFAEWVDDNDFRQGDKGGIWENLGGKRYTTAELLDLFWTRKKRRDEIRTN